MSKRVASLITGFMDLVTLPLNKRQRSKTFGHIVHTLEHKGNTIVSKPRGLLKFPASKGSGTASAVATFDKNSDEPETLEWVDDHIKSGDTFWDIGASIGIYSLYAALDPEVKVLSFEPSGIDFSLITELVSSNNMSDRIKPFCIALSDETKIDILHMSKFESGCGGNAVGKAITSDHEFTPLFSQAIQCFTGDDFCKIFKLQPPNHIKLDVDGIEGKIIKGLEKTLPYVSSIIIEIEGSNVENVSELIETPLKAAGFKEDLSCREKGGKRNRIYINKNKKGSKQTLL